MIVFLDKLEERNNNVKQSVFSYYFKSIVEKDHIRFNKSQLANDKSLRILLELLQEDANIHTDRSEFSPFCFANKALSFPYSCIVESVESIKIFFYT